MMSVGISRVNEAGAVLPALIAGARESGRAALPRMLHGQHPQQEHTGGLYARAAADFPGW